MHHQECCLPCDSPDFLTCNFYEPDFELDADDFIYVPRSLDIPENRPALDQSPTFDFNDTAAAVADQLRAWNPSHCDQRIEKGPGLVTGWLKHTFPVTPYNPIEPRFIRTIRRRLEGGCN